jgi:hypothetical protein
MLPPLTEPGLIAYAASRGVVITPSQLKRWRAEKLLPPVTRPGLGRAKGRETLYPAEAGPWVVDLAQILAADRSLSRAGWAMWLKGYPLIDYARSYLVDSAERMEAFFYRLASGDFDKESPVFAEARRRAAFRVILKAGSGLPVSAIDIDEYNTSIENMAPGLVPPAKAGEFPPRMTAWGAAIANAPDEVLRSVRDEVLILRFALEILLDLKDAPPMAPLMLLWFGVTQMTPVGQQVRREIGIAVATGRVSQFLDRLRPSFDVARRVLKPLRELAETPKEKRSGM